MTTGIILTGIVMAMMAFGSIYLLGGKILLTGKGRDRFVAAVIPLSVLVAIGVYIMEGAFGTSDNPLANREAEITAARETAAEQEETQRSAFEEARRTVIENPNDIEARFALAEAAAIAGDSKTEIETLKHILTVTGDLSLHAMIAEALTREAGGIVTIKALEELERGLAADPNDWRARYFKGLYLSQNDNDEAALDIWVPLAGDLFGSPVFPAVAAAVEQSAARLGMDPATLLPQAQTEVTNEDILTMVNSLEERLLAGDTHEEREAWIMLVRSMMILGDLDRRDRVLDHYLNLDLKAPEDSATIISMAEVMMPPDNLPENIPPVLINLIQKARDITPDQPSVLFFSGLIARQQQDRAGIIDHWGKLRQQIGDDNPLSALLDAELAAANQ